DNSWYNISNEEYSNNNEDSISDIKMNKGQNVDNDAFMRNIEDDMYNTEDDKYTKDIDDIQNMNDNEYVEINELKKGTD
ncbi:11680_t:CDS:1, partial [Rhizophagus irregularis]